MTKRKFYTFFGLVMGPIIGFFAVLYIGASLMKLPLVLVVVFACLFAIYESQPIPLIRNPCGSRSALGAISWAKICMRCWGFPVKIK